MSQQQACRTVKVEPHEYKYIKQTCAETMMDEIRFVHALLCQGTYANPNTIPLKKFIDQHILKEDQL